MPIIYSVVARGNTVLAEYASARGNFDQVARKILQKIPTQNNKMSYTHERFDTFIYIAQKQLSEMFFLCFVVLL